MFVSLENEVNCEDNRQKSVPYVMCLYLNPLSEWSCETCGHAHNLLVVTKETAGCHTCRQKMVYFPGESEKFILDYHHPDAADLKHFDSVNYIGHFEGNGKEACPSVEYYINIYKMGLS